MDATGNTAAGRNQKLDFCLYSVEIQGNECYPQLEVAAD